MTDENEQDDLGLEELLRQVIPAEPSRRLDRRIDALFHRRWTAFIGPITGFAVGIFVTVLAMRQFSWPSEHHTIRPQSVQAQDGKPSPAGPPGFWIEDQQVRELGNINVGGIPVSVEQSSPHVVMWRQTANGKLWRADMELPQQLTLRPVQRF